ncbi:MAG TPA: hypothetical protein VMU94_05130 [Streptosporangiaceae bacterium]|nr:hypothetical protein [Streptosporangiaceae bacterium]
MKIKKIAAATLVPVAVAGVTVSSWAAVQASTSHPSAHAAAHHVREVHPVRPLHPAGQHKAGHAADGSAHKQASKARAVSTGRDHARHGAQAKAHHRAHAKAAAAPAAQPAAPSSASLTSGMSAFEQCVAWRESGDNPTASSAGLFGILPSTWASLGFPGTAGGSSVALQKAAFDKLYAQDGTSPWAPYDGC